MRADTLHLIPMLVFEQSCRFDNEPTGVANQARFFSSLYGALGF